MARAAPRRAAREGARSRGSESSSGVPSPSAPRRVSARARPGSSCCGSGRPPQGAAPRRLLLGVAFLRVAGAVFTRAMSAFRWLRDHYRAIQIVGGAIIVALGLLPSSSVLHPARVREPASKRALASSPRSERHTRGAGQTRSPDSTSERARATSSRSSETSTPRCTGAYRASRRVAFSS